jgi:tetratricopeptide (TPR) repeat protein
VWKLPLVFVINNNQWAISVPRKAQSASRTIAQKAIAAGIPSLQVDGNDVIAVHWAQRVMHAAEVHYRLGNVYFRKGDLDAAISSWNQALRIDPGLESAREMLEKAKRLKPVTD